jgi:hypothetical protein
MIYGINLQDEQILPNFRQNLVDLSALSLKVNQLRFCVVFANINNPESHQIVQIAFVYE